MPSKEKNEKNALKVSRMLQNAGTGKIISVQAHILIAILYHHQVNTIKKLSSYLSSHRINSALTKGLNSFLAFFCQHRWWLTVYSGTLQKQTLG